MDNQLLAEFIIGYNTSVELFFIKHLACSEKSGFVHDMSEATEFVMTHKCPSKPVIGAEHFG